MHQWTRDDVTGLGSAQADIRVPEQVEKALGETKPDWVVLSAAYTDVDGCELNPTLASAVNTQGASNVAEAARAVGVKVVFISTDYVFDGKKRAPYTEEDEANPISIYGESKLAGEKNVLSADEQHVVVRVADHFEHQQRAPGEQQRGGGPALQRPAQPSADGPEQPRTRQHQP